MTKCFNISLNPPRYLMYIYAIIRMYFPHLDITGHQGDQAGTAAVSA